MADDEYIYDERTGEFKKKSVSTYSNSNNKTTNPPPSPPNNDDDGCLGGCIFGLLSLIINLIIEFWWVICVIAFLYMCSQLH